MKRFLEGVAGIGVGLFSVAIIDGEFHKHGSRGQWGWFFLAIGLIAGTAVVALWLYRRFFALPPQPPANRQEQRRRHKRYLAEFLVLVAGVVVATYGDWLRSADWKSFQSGNATLLWAGIGVLAFGLSTAFVAAKFNSLTGGKGKKDKG